MDTKDLLAEILNGIEERESELLVWGDTGGFFSEEELIDLIEEITNKKENRNKYDADDLDADALIDELVDCAMIFPEIGGADLYRSRMAWAVHLYKNLRQWFHGKNITESKTLVSDFRFLRKPRHYPDRNISGSQLLSAWQANGLTNEIQSKILQVLIGDYQLSGFQARATEDILSKIPSSRRRRPTASIICAGTGSGKTNAFYWPALTNIAADVLSTSDTRLRALAVYPRIELLKDQFNEAWHQCRRLDAVMVANGGRKIRISALFGDTIHTLGKVKDSDKSYFSFNYLKCATPKCRGEMRWNRSDFERGIERLACNKCDFDVTEDQISLTRESMKKTPPDILFTTTEMLNFKMSDPYYRNLFGFRSRHPVPLVLMDEVHTYSGEGGANIAFLLRRWMKMAKMAPHFVGLSATLVDAEAFFARLTGSEQYNTQLIEPLDKEMIEEGSEYLLALRGDAVSQTALLSTTIQSSMLAARLQEPRENGKSHGAWGAKTFVFCDNLDLVNRLYYQLYDAEGWVLNGRRLIPKRSESLVTLRNSSRGHENKKTLGRYGQDWWITEQIGHDLGEYDRARIARTSGQDGGVDEDAQIIVATSKLEVGFNDPDVGTVIQHKAPQNVASYLQRKGRAGRVREMRPWTIAVLSEFGKDRSTFQRYERLLDPEVEALVLPIENDHILRMQAAIVTLEWLADDIDSDFSPWKDLNYPDRLQSSVKNNLLQALNNVLDGRNERTKLKEYICEALLISEKVVDPILWSPPRSIFNAVIPNLIRKLQTNWGRWNDSNKKIESWSEKNRSWTSPLPEFIPEHLFSSLSAPDLQINLQRGDGFQHETMPFFSGLKEFAPGKISKRFSISRGDYSDWVFPDDLSPSSDLHGSDIGVEIGEVFGINNSLIDRVYCPEQDSTIDIVRPTEIMPKSLAPQLQMTEKSNAILRWYSEYTATQKPRNHKIPAESYWDNELLNSLSFYTHQTMTPLRILRYTTGSNATLNFKNGQHSDISFNWKLNESPVGIGTTLQVDAVCMEFVLSKEDILTRILDKSILGSLRFGYLKDQLENSQLFEGNTFNANWVHECFITAVTLEVKLQNISVIDAVEAVCEKKSGFSLEDTKHMLFKDDFELVEEELESEEERYQLRKEQKLQADLRELFGRSEVLHLLKQLGKETFGPLEQNCEFVEWCRNVIAHTLAAGAQQTVCTLFPQVSDQDLVVDTRIGDDSISIWLSERGEGGGGIIAEFERMYFTDTLGVLNTFARMMQVGTYEQLDVDLTTLLKNSFTDERIKSAFHEVRASRNYKDRRKAMKKIESTVKESGFEFSHSFSAVLFSRILKPNSSERTDKELYDYLKQWQALEESVDIEIPINIIAAVIAAVDAPNDIFKRACEIQSVLWVRGCDIRQEALPFYNPFQGEKRTERLLAAKICQDKTTEVFHLSSDWLQRIYEVLEKFARVDLVVSRENKSEISKLITNINVTPLDTYGLLLYPRIVSIHRDLENIRIRVELSEVMH